MKNNTFASKNKVASDNKINSIFSSIDLSQFFDMIQCLIFPEMRKEKLLEKRTEIISKYGYENYIAAKSITEPVIEKMPSELDNTIKEEKPEMRHDKYYNMSTDDIASILSMLNSHINDFMRFYSNDNIEYITSELDIIDAILQVGKKVQYYNTSHDMNPGNNKIAAMYSYWVARLRPIKIIDKRYINTNGYNNRVNECFAVHFLLSALVGVGKIKPRDGTQLTVENPFVDNLIYSLRFRNLSIDTFILVADSITTDSFSNFLTGANP